ncbi:hypothetical protein H5410_023164 [Solanum commersonii]|uniref:Uncharacterized protein n=1 Tax=Solanum commersonii TaxID=4109 RepID=A0A9J5ZG28_SOLCO|nr:hypothetical protein H5410_023164 [Solanum commersonii]
MDQEDIKSTRLEEVDIPQNLDLLNKWTIPRVNIKTIYDYGWFDKISNKQVTETFLASTRCEEFKFSPILMGSIESTAAYGPLYFNALPNLRLSLDRF